jgi:hypothetical protein
MLLNVHRKHWSKGLNLSNFEAHDEQDREAMKVNLPFPFFLAFNPIERLISI